MNVYASRRREPRVSLKTRAVLVVPSKLGPARELDVISTDISPHGVAVMAPEAVPVGSVVVFFGRGYGFRARARVQNCAWNPAIGRFHLGLQYLGKTNPLVVWSGRDDTVRDGTEDRRSRKRARRRNAVA